MSHFGDRYIAKTERSVAADSRGVDTYRALRSGRYHILLGDIAEYNINGFEVVGTR